MTSRVQHEVLAGLAALASLQGGVISRRQALDARLTRSEIETLVRGPWVRQRAGAFQLPGTATQVGHLELSEQVVLAAALLRHRDAVVTHESASRTWGIPLVGVHTQRATVSRQGTRPRTPDAASHGRVLVSTLPPHHIALIAGWLRVSTPPRTVADLARTRGLRAGLVAADHALHVGITSPDDLSAMARDCRNFPGAQLIEDVAALASPLPETPLESISRYEFHRAGLSEPALQQVICDSDGRFVARADFLLDDWVVGESDGKGKYLSRDDLIEEKLREDRLRELGYEVVRWTWDEIWFTPEIVIARIVAAIARARRRRAVLT